MDLGTLAHKQDARLLVQNLVELGLTFAEAIAWAAFISRWADYLAHAETSLKVNWNGLIAKIEHRPKSNPNLPEETDISKEIYLYCCDHRYGFDMKDPMYDMEFKCEDPVPSKRKTGKESDRIDLCVVCSEAKLNLVCEAKRLYKGSITDYLGEAGLGVFTMRVEPYSSHPVAAMLGYIFDGTVDGWLQKIERRRNRKFEKYVIVGGNKLSVPISMEDRTGIGLPSLILIHRMIDFSDVFVSHNKSHSGQ